MDGRPVTRGSTWIVAAAVLVASTVVTAGSSSAARCSHISSLRVPGAERQKKACLDDLTTAGTTRSGHTNPNDWSGLHADGTRNPRNVAGIQIDGYFPDRSTTNSNNGWFHDSQFVIRLPNDWNGKLVVTGAPGVRGQYANDFIISDWVLARGYAFASTDKGNTGTGFYRDGRDPADAVAEWHRRVTQLTRAAKAVVRQRYARGPRRTYVTGISNGGYLTRWALEKRPRLYDGGLDWEGTLFRARGPNLFTYLPVTLRHYPEYRATGGRRHLRAMVRAGFKRRSRFLWDYHYSVYWDLTQRIYREEFDPDYDGDLPAGVPFCRPGTPNCDADYRYFRRPERVRRAVRRISNSGDIGKPMITLHGTLDSLLPIEEDSHVYRRLVHRAGRAARHRYYVIGRGNHVDGLYDEHPRRLRPLLPCYRAAFKALEGWVESEERPPDSRFVKAPRRGVVNNCVLGGVRYHR
ncbi:MAG: tannase/feruloyl esterase family alpha/beta hydrolase [Actinomycetota bacterium]